MRELIGKGANARVYKINDFEVYKDLTNNIDELGDVEVLVNYTSKHFVFPKRLVYEKDTLVGYIMDYIEGVNLEEISLDISIDKFINILEDLEEEVFNLTEKGIKIEDLYLKDMFLTPSEEIVVVDTDLFKVLMHFDKRALIKDNISELNNELFRLIIKCDISNFDYSTKELTENLILNKKITFSTFLKKLLVLNSDVKLVTLNDLINHLKIKYSRINETKR